MPANDNPIERAPFPGNPNRNNRVYVAAEWAASGSWTGSPKLSGGFETSRNEVTTAPRGLNRTDQRYALSASEMRSRRELRGAAELADMAFLITELDRFEVQSQSGKTLDAVPLAIQAFRGSDGELHMCQCEDDWRMRESGYDFTTVCKHVVALRLWLLATTVDERFYSLEYVASQTPYSLRTLEAMCKREFLPAEKVGRQWGISPVVIEQVISDLLARIVPLPHVFSG